MTEVKSGMPVEKVTQALIEASKLLSPLGITILAGIHDAVVTSESHSLRIERMDCVLYFRERVEKKEQEKLEN